MGLASGGDILGSPKGPRTWFNVLMSLFRNSSKPRTKRPFHPPTLGPTNDAANPGRWMRRAWDGPTSEGLCSP